MKIKYSIIIPTCDRIDMLAQCIEAIEKGIHKADSSVYEVIVADDSKSGATKEWVSKKYPWIIWLQGPRSGPAANRNNGAIKANGEWLIFIDDDCIPDSDLPKEYDLARMKFREINVFEGRITSSRERQNLIEESPLNETGGYLWSCNFMINRSFFVEDIGGFDEAFPHAAMEDVDLNYRLKKKDEKIIFLPAAFVVHPWRNRHSEVSFYRKRFKSVLYYIDKHPEIKEEINSVYYLRAFYQSFVKDTLKNSIRYRFKGLWPKLTYDFMQLYFFFYMMLRKS